MALQLGSAPPCDKRAGATPSDNQDTEKPEESARSGSVRPADSGVGRDSCEDPEAASPRAVRPVIHCRAMERLLRLHSQIAATS